MRMIQNTGVMVLVYSRLMPTNKHPGNVVDSGQMQESDRNTVCGKCAFYFYGWRSHSPYFPDNDWEILEKTDIQVGTHASVDVMEGVSACKQCGQKAYFYCSYGDGYGFTRKEI